MTLSNKALDALDDEGGIDRPLCVFV